MSGHGILKYFQPITHKMYAPEKNKDPPEGKELLNLFGSYIWKVIIYHRHRDQLPTVMLT